MNYTIYPNFITPEENTKLITYVNSKIGKPFKEHPPMCNGEVVSLILPADDPYHNIIRTLQNRLADLLNVPFIPEASLGTCIPVIHPGGHLRKHTDKVAAGNDYIRGNVMIQLPDEGGQPIVASELLTVANNDLWVFNPTKHEHACQKVIGTLPRVTLSIGLTIA